MQLSPLNDHNNVLTVLIHDLKTTWSTKISLPFSVLWTICFKYVIYIIYQKGVDNFEIQHKTWSKFWLGVQYPLTQLLTKIHVPNLFIYLFMYLFIYLLIYLFIYLFICLFICLFINACIFRLQRGPVSF